VNTNLCQKFNTDTHQQINHICKYAASNFHSVKFHRFEKDVSESYPFGQVAEKDTSKASNLNIVINNARCHLADLTFDFDHVIQNQMSKYK